MVTHQRFNNSGLVLQGITQGVQLLLMGGTVLLEHCVRDPYVEFVGGRNQIMMNIKWESLFSSITTIRAQKMPVLKIIKIKPAFNGSKFLHISGTVSQHFTCRWLFLKACSRS